MILSIRAANCSACAAGTFSASTRNSSPPQRTTRSSPRTASFRRRATSHSTRSPAACPWPSLTCLKWSMSTSSNAPSKPFSLPARACSACITERKWRRLARLVSGSRSLCTRNWAWLDTSWRLVARTRRYSSVTIATESAMTRAATAQMRSISSRLVSAAVLSWLSRASRSMSRCLRSRSLLSCSCFKAASRFSRMISALSVRSRWYSSSALRSSPAAVSASSYSRSISACSAVSPALRASSSTRAKSCLPSSIRFRPILAKPALLVRKSSMRRSLWRRTIGRPRSAARNASAGRFCLAYTSLRNVSTLASRRGESARRASGSASSTRWRTASCSSRRLAICASASFVRACSTASPELAASRCAWRSSGCAASKLLPRAVSHASSAVLNVKR